MSDMSTCATCQLINCVNPQDFQTYSLESDAFFSPQFTFVVQCPPGFNCAPGTFPQTIVIPPGQFIIPGGIPSGGSSAFPVQLKCCSSTLTATVPAGSTMDQINTIMMGLFLQCAEQQAMCNAINSPPPRSPVPQSQVPFTNDLLSLVVCASGGTPSFSPPLPGNFLIIGTELIIVPGSISSLISKADANAQAQAQLNAVAGTVTCQFGIDFKNLVWGIEQDNCQACATTNGGVYSGAVATVSVNVPVGCNDGWNNVASMHYTGPACACQVQISGVSFTGGNGTNGWAVVIYQDGVKVVNQSGSTNTTINFNLLSGTNSFIQIGQAGPVCGQIQGVEIVTDLADFGGTNFTGTATFTFLPHT